MTRRIVFDNCCSTSNRQIQFKLNFETHGKIIIPADLVLDEEADKKAINAKMEELVKLAETNGLAVGYSQGFTLTIEIIRDWLPIIKKRGIIVTPISTILEGHKE